jgi:hypothetical protein
MLVLGLVLTVFVVNFVKNAVDPEKQWQGIAQILPYDERPPEMEPVFGTTIGVEQYTLRDSRGFQVQIRRMTGTMANDTREQLFVKDPPQIPKEVMAVRFETPKSALVEVQGREIHVVRTRLELQGIAKKFVPKEAQEHMGSMLWADVTPEGRDDLVMMQLSRDRAGPRDVAPESPISDDELREILKPFHVGPKR